MCIYLAPGSTKLSSGNVKYVSLEESNSKEGNLSRPLVSNIHADTAGTTSEAAAMG